MTTTLRPAGREERDAAGGRARTFDVRVNGRRAGGLRLALDASVAPGAGRIADLEIDAPHRRRGRGTVAVLAAEEVLRAWGCGQAVAAVPAGAGGALALAAALGWTERNRTMDKHLAERPPALPPGYTARPMTAAEYPCWLETERTGFVRSWTDRGLSPRAAAARADAACASLLLDGPAGTDTALRVLAHRGTEVGTLWVSTAPERLRQGQDAYVHAVLVDEKHRGHGHGRALMLEAERLCRAAGGRLLGLNVFAGNTPAERLYTSLGYRPVEHHFYKPLV